MQTGELMLLGNTGIENIMAITVKDGVIYAMDRVGDLYTLNEVSGFSTRIASAVLPGVTGIDTSPATVVNPVDGNVDNNNGGDVTATEGGAAGGSLSVWLLLSMAMLSLLRRRIA